jgi:hypothetical protein
MLRSLAFGTALIAASTALTACSSTRSTQAVGGCSFASVNTYTDQGNGNITVFGNFPDAVENEEALVMAAIPPGGSALQTYNSNTTNDTQATFSLAPGTYTEVEWAISGCQIDGEDEEQIEGPTVVTVN